MADEQKEIEGMTQAILGEARCKESCADCYLLTARKSNGEPYAICYPRKEAIRLYEAGYRKADEVRRETAKEIIDNVDNILKALLKLGCGIDEINCKYIKRSLYSEYGVIIDTNATH